MTFLSSAALAARIADRPRLTALLLFFHPRTLLTKSFTGTRKMLGNASTNAAPFNCAFDLLTPFEPSLRKNRWYSTLIPQPESSRDLDLDRIRRGDKDQKSVPREHFVTTWASILCNIVHPPYRPRQIMQRCVLKMLLKVLA